MSQLPFSFNMSGGPPPPPPPMPRPHQSTPSTAPPQHSAAAPPQQQQQQQQPQSSAPNAQIPGMDLSFLQNIPPHQLAQILSAFQSGVLQLPPQTPNPLATAPPTQQQLPQAQPPTQPASQPQQQQSQPQASSAGTRPDEEAEDREEGELEEEPEVQTQTRHAPLSRPPPPSGSNKRSASPKDSYGRSINRRAPSSQARSQSAAAEHPAKLRKVSEYGGVGQAGGMRNASTNGRRGVDVGSAARNFVLMMHKSGYTFEQLAQEVPNRGALRKMYGELGLPVPPESAGRLPGQANGWTASQKPAEDTGKKTDVKRPAAPAPKAAPPANRAEYLDKLAKLKSNKPGQTPAPPVAQPKPVEQKPATQQANTAQRPSPHPPAPAPTLASEAKPTTAATGNATARPEEQRHTKVINTELIKQRMAKLQAEREAKMAEKAAADAAAGQALPGGPMLEKGPSAASNSMAPSPVNQPPVQQAPPQAPAPIQTSYSPAPPTPGRPFSALPGLFFGGHPSQHASPATQQTRNPTLPPSSSSPRPPPPTLNAVAASKPAPSLPSKPARQAFGPSRSNSESEAVIIEDSGDEEDEEPEAAEALQAVPPIPTSKPTPNGGYASSGTATPMSKAQWDARWKANNDELEKAKKALAERQARLKTTPHARPASNGTTAAAPAAAGGLSSPPAVASGITTPQPLQIVDGVHGERPMSAAARARSQEVERLRKRQAELEAQLKGKGVTPISAEEPSMSGALPATARVNEPEAEGLADTAAVVEAEADGDGEEMDVSSDGDGGEDGEVVDEEVVPLVEERVEEIAKEGDVGNSQDSTVGTSQPEAPARDEDGKGPSATDQATDTAAHFEVDDEGEDAMDLSSDESSGDEDEEEEEEEEDLDGSDRQTQSAPKANTTELTDASGDASSGTSEDEDDEEGEYEPEPVSPPEPSTRVEREAPSISHPAPTATAPDARPTSDELAPELQPNPAPSALAEPPLSSPPPQHQPQHQHQPLTSTPASNTAPPRRFTPYVSPLTLFKDFRFHPLFPATVPGGFRSLTYSHRLDDGVQKTVCPWESGVMGAEGPGPCREGGECGGVHLGDVGVSDTALLQHLGTARTPTTTPEEEKRWREGLGMVIRELRKTNAGKDVERIAERIVEFRRGFLGEGRVLRLD